VARRAHRLGALVGVVAVTLATVAALSLSAGAVTPQGQDAGPVTTTTTPIELGPATSVTADPTPPTTEPEIQAPEVEGEQVFAERNGGASWAWWLLLLLLLPAVGFGFGVVRQRLSSTRR
jgi:hypothetical protein